MSRETDNERLVRRLQTAEGLVVDGWAGPTTQNALTDLLLRAGVEVPPSAPAEPGVLSRLTPQLVKACFPPATPYSNIVRFLPTIKNALREAGLVDAPMVAMALATIRAETEGFEPVEEGVSKYNTDPGAHPFNRYDYRTDLGNAGPPDGERGKGRGFIQLTGIANYIKYGRRLGIDLVGNPELANRPDIAARILVEFLKDKKDEIRRALAKGDKKRARKLVNGGSHGLARFEETYDRAVRLLRTPDQGNR